MELRAMKSLRNIYWTLGTLNFSLIAVNLYLGTAGAWDVINLVLGGIMFWFANDYNTAIKLVEERKAADKGTQD
jgi:hypothetical protein